jgi:hypothetical protein
MEQRKKKRKSIKTENFFNFNQDLAQAEEGKKLYLEEGLPLKELE